MIKVHRIIDYFDQVLTPMFPIIGPLSRGPICTIGTSTIEVRYVANIWTKLNRISTYLTQLFRNKSTSALN